MKEWKRIFLIGAITALSSELYWNMFIPGFRISTSVILLPILIMTVGKNLPTLAIGSATAGIVFLFRLFLNSNTDMIFGEALALFLPNAIFYFCYGVLFRILIPNKHTVSYQRLFPAIWVCDFGSNIVELCVSEILSNQTLTTSMVSSLGLIALFRALLAGLFLIAEGQYRVLLKHEEHENRYRRLFLMTTGLKNEIYFMRKNSEEIESVMSNAYRLYERLSALGDEIPEDMKRMSLSIARDVHEIKKDYIRIIQGIEQEIDDEYDEKRMSFHDLLSILEATTYHILEEKNAKVQLNFHYSDDFITNEHYELMAVLKNLVTNAIEAIESSPIRHGTVSIEEQKEGDFYRFTVTDDGPGISPRNLPNIFKMGYSTKFDYKTGNIFRGVGLFGVKATVEDKFHGTIDVSSAPGTGTTFVIRIPAASLEEV